MRRSFFPTETQTTSIKRNCSKANEVCDIVSQNKGNDDEYTDVKTDKDDMKFWAVMNL